MNNNVENFITKLENKDECAFTLEISPQAKYDLAYIKDKIDNSAISDYIDAFVVTDSPFANLKISSILAALQLQQRLNNNKPFITTQTMRDRNSIALQNDLIGANYFDIRMVLAVTGDAIANGNQKQAKAVFEGNSELLINIIKDLNKGKSLGEFAFKEPLKHIYPFCVINSYAKNNDTLKLRLAKKANSGVKAIFTQPIYEAERLELFLKWIDELPLKEKPILVPGFFPVLSYKTAYFIYYKLPGAYIPETWLNKLKEASDKSPEEEKKAAVELSTNLFKSMIKKHKKMHIMSMNNYDFVVELLKSI
ncbi:methylenetetrahydrofolate reductase [Brachyspira hampsonii]|uniref:Methylenetetrahydrofolate reductase n=1 Tax=Brachyspira hampsonii TaxID=1287055 RepID=A0AAC9TTL3_9SPIR|nr:methylenetetrahydrofolate reductase [Brachyspira hampsonii]ASJ20166.1 methylenetetrahydrofolate reductase [Brachyspira hampsonii]ELV04921.1 methylenetetrahydrofolate reductase [Brachyspira hampsonii 30599]MBW5380884.1 methylenetetrahydrofolate reductase [Brachyspira hampsonii]MBW5409566.1 methylenetetrahydrofolate reductase [Brachyspira hampsonii]OEJ16572.1 methylenetetrahydrofolate reductase [Brachyspira hampsonii]